MKIVILERDTLGADIDISGLDKFGEVVSYNLSTPKEATERVVDADVIIANKVPMNEETLKNANNLKLIALSATGYNVVDGDYVRKRGIKVANVKGYSTSTVAQHTFALLLYLFDKLGYYEKYVREGDYINAPFFSNFECKFRDLKGMTWGIVGLGDIGTRVATIAEAFGCNIIYYSTSGANSSSEFKRVEFEDLLSSSDIISIHAPLNDNTYNLFAAEEFKKMKDTSILLNLGRGSIVNEADLASALLNNDIGGAGLDVLEKEPMEEENPLLKINDNSKLIITPHIAWASIDARQRVTDEIVLNIEAFIKGENRNIVYEF